MLKDFFRKYIDKRVLYTDLFRIILLGIFALFWKSRIVIIDFISIKLFNWLGIVLSWEISVPIIPLLILIVLLIFSSYFINWVLIKRKLRKGNISRKNIDDWIVSTDQTAPQWTSFKEIELENKLLSDIRLDLYSKKEYIRFGFKLLDKKASIFGKNGILHFDNNFLIHIGKQVNDNKICYTAYKNGGNIIKSEYAVDYNNNTAIKIGLSIDRNNKLIFKINNTIFYTTTINPLLRERLILMAWGDRNEYEMKIDNIKIQTID